MNLTVEVTVYVILLATPTNAHEDRDHDVLYLGCKAGVSEAQRYVEQVTQYDEWRWQWVGGRCMGFDPHHHRAIWLVEETL